MTTAEQNDVRMAGSGINKNERFWRTLRVVGWSCAALFMLLPFVAGFFTHEVQWSVGDYLFAGILLGGIGLLFELSIGLSKDDAYRTGVLLALAATLLLVWSNAAVGFVGTGANAANVAYFAMLAVPIIGGFLVGFKARGMFITMVATAMVQALITVFAFVGGLVGEVEGNMIITITTVFVLIWIASAMLFHRSAANEASAAVAGQGGGKPFGKFPIQFVLSLLVAAIGTVLMIFMITVEDEPGLLPLVMIVVGGVWFLVTLNRSRASR